MSQTKEQRKGEKPITPNQYFDFAESKYLKESIFSSQMGAISKTLKAIDEDVDDSQNGDEDYRINWRRW